VALVFRAITSKRVWDKNRSEGEQWLANADVRADALKSLKTEDNTLSIYIIDELIQLDRLLAAYCAGRQRIGSIDFVLFNQTILDDVQVECVASSGKVPDLEVARWHGDLVRLSGRRLVELACRIQNDGTIERRLDKPVARLIRASLHQQFFREQELTEELLASLSNPKYG